MPIRTGDFFRSPRVLDRAQSRISPRGSGTGSGALCGSSTVTSRLPVGYPSWLAVGDGAGLLAPVRPELDLGSGVGLELSVGESDVAYCGQVRDWSRRDGRPHRLSAAGLRTLLG